MEKNYTKYFYLFSFSNAISVTSKPHLLNLKCGQVIVNVFCRFSYKEKLSFFPFAFFLPFDLNPLCSFLPKALDDNYKYNLKRKKNKKQKRFHSNH